MAFPEFEPGKRSILFFSRGRGRGHAIPDIEIARELLDEPALSVRFVSYGTGAATLGEFDMPLIELDLPEANPITETTVLAAKLIGWLHPNLVVSHEEFPALPAAAIFDTRCVLLTDWFSEPTQYAVRTLRYATRVLFLDQPGAFEEPPPANGRVEYVGPIFRRFTYGRANRGQARAELGIPENALVVAVLPGSWNESRAPIADLVLAAFDRLPGQEKRLLWIAGEDHELIRSKSAARMEIVVKDVDWRIDRIMAASDVAITKANRKTVLELAALGIPSVALCPGLNPMDERRLERLDSVVRRRFDAISAAELESLLLSQARTKPTCLRAPTGTAARVARRIRELLPAET